MSKWFAKCSDWAPTVLRVVLGIVFIAHGYGKLWGGAPGMEAFTGMVVGLGMPAFMAYVAAIVEFFGGILVLLGLFTRYAATLIGIVMLVAIFRAKWGMPLVGGYELDLALLAIAVALMLSGPGKLSLEATIFKKEW
ncbi:DoxX family protein [Candidatus Woesearchaeota archaeon]|nr:DoxX family protein [Candidatus Woesearchaeota archaeon]